MFPNKGRLNGFIEPRPPLLRLVKPAPRRRFPWFLTLLAVAMVAWTWSGIVNANQMVRDLRDDGSPSVAPIKGDEAPLPPSSSSSASSEAEEVLDEATVQQGVCYCPRGAVFCDCPVGMSQQTGDPPPIKKPAEVKKRGERKAKKPRRARPRPPPPSEGEVAPA